MQQDLFSETHEQQPKEEYIPLDPDGVSWLKRYPGFIPANQCQPLFDSIHSETPWQQDQIRIAGKQLPIPRLQAWFGDIHTQYGYSGIELTPHPLPANLEDLKTKIEAISHSSFNSVLVNLYRDGQDSVSWHADDERELGTNPVIASLSLGTTRRFSLKHKQDKSFATQHIDLASGDLLIMGGATQHHWLHQVAKTKAVTLPRINLTFRKIQIK